MRAPRAVRTLALVLALPLGARGAAAQETGDGRCVLVIENVDREGRRETTPGGINYYAGGNVRMRCRDQNVHMETDSIAAYAGRVVEFIGHVRYRDSTLRMTADRGTYYREGERWESRGSVVAENLETGSTLRGPSLDYLRAVEGVRDTFEMYATGRPRVKYATRDSAGEPGEPYDIVSDRLRLRGNDLVWAGGRVTVDRSDFRARGDSLRLDTGAGNSGTLVRGRPEVQGVGTDSFTLRGRRIDFVLEDEQLTFVTALDSARAITADWDLAADTIALDVNDDRLEQTFAWGRGRTVARSDDYLVRADSLAIDTPDERLRELRAFGRAWLGSAVDSATGERDWIAGDTVVATFVPRDTTARESALERMQARGSARAFQQVANEDRPGRPSLNYARGEVITITMAPPAPGKDQEVDRVDIRGQVEGVQLEPADQAAAPPAPRGPARPPADSAAPAPARVAPPEGP